MLFCKTKASEKRKNFKDALKSGKLLQLPGAFAPVVARQIEEAKFDGVYISGAVLSADLCLPDIGLTTLSEVCERGKQIARVTKLPSIIDLDTGFGEALNAARSLQLIEEAGLAGCHLEDQQNPKRCGHLDNKVLVSTQEMTRKIKAAASAKNDPNFCLIARTDSRASEGLDKAIDRAKAYIDAGADLIFPEALADEKEFEKFRSEVKAPLLANMTEFGKSKILSKKELEALGYNLVIYPVTLLRLALKSSEKALETIKKEGSQESLLGQMQHRKDLYKLLNYEAYNDYDQNIYNFSLKD